MNDPLKLTGEPKSNEDARIRNDRALADLAEVMSAPPGRRFVWSLMKRSSLLENAFSGKAATTDFLLGQQFVVQELLQVLWTSRFMPVFRLMQDEAMESDKAELLKEAVKKENSNGR